jgi:hypothetical protein
MIVGPAASFACFPEGWHFFVLVLQDVCLRRDHLYERRSSPVKGKRRLFLSPQVRANAVS